MNCSDLASFAGKTILITGGTGSFGNAVLDRLLPTEVGQIRVFSRDEKKQDDMRHKYKSAKIKFHIGDVRDIESIEEAMQGVDYVFHAAALKQVPSCEFHPIEAVRTNVLGTENTLRAATAAGVSRVVVLSTDKAAYPINAMGLSKALMEKVAIARSRIAVAHGCVIACTRYGNVMASRGSVIPLFLDQIASGRPLTLTDPMMTRFMMTLDAAVDLVFFAFAHARPGDLFVQKAPAATIQVLAEALLEVLRLDHPMITIGTRHGEKLYETLVTREEMAKAEDMGEYFRISADNRDLNYSLYFSEGNLQMSELEDYHSHNTRRLTRDEVKALLLQLPVVRQAAALQDA